MTWLWEVSVEEVCVGGLRQRDAVIWDRWRWGFLKEERFTAGGG